MGKLKFIFFIYLCFYFAVSCKQQEEKNTLKGFNLEKDLFQGGSIEILLKDTLKLNEIQEIEIRLVDTINENIKTSLNDFKILEGCILFPTEKSLVKLKNEFDKKCDSVFSMHKSLKDTISISFNYKATALGKNYFLAKLEVKNYIKLKDSTRLITFKYSLEEEFFVVP